MRYSIAHCVPGDGSYNLLLSSENLVSKSHPRYLGFLYATGLRVACEETGRKRCFGNVQRKPRMKKSAKILELPISYYNRSLPSVEEEGLEQYGPVLII